MEEQRKWKEWEEIGNEREEEECKSAINTILKKKH